MLTRLDVLFQNHSIYVTSPEFKDKVLEVRKEMEELFITKLVGSKVKEKLEKILLGDYNEPEKSVEVNSLKNSSLKMMETILSERSNLSRETVTETDEELSERIEQTFLTLKQKIHKIKKESVLDESSVDLLEHYEVLLFELEYNSLVRQIKNQ